MTAHRFLALSPLLFAASLSAQTLDHAGHQGHDMPGMAMPEEMPAPSPDPHAGHTTADPEVKPQPRDGAGMQGMAMPEAAPVQANGPAGTDLEPGNASPPRVATDRPADRYFDPRAMAAAQADLLGKPGGMTFHKIMFNLAEYQVHNGRDGYRWDASAWFGGDIDRLAVKSEGEGSFGDPLDHGEVQALWSRAVDPYWNLQGGIRQDFGKGLDHTYAVLGIEGLAPYWFDLGASAYLSTEGDVLARVEADIDQRLTQRLILQPRLEANFAAQDIPEDAIGSGLSNLELGLRVRYEIAREFAPYIGVSWDRKFGDTARYARVAGEPVSATNFVAGIRFWF